jgi:hypothetical protein
MAWLDATIDELLAKLSEKLRAEFQREAEAEHLMPDKDGFVAGLRNYRNETLRKHLLEQVKVLALPTSAQAFPAEKGGPDELKKRIAQYWNSCREALDKFFRSVEMVLLDGVREGISLESSLIRDRLVAAQYRNGYRLLDDRFRHIYSEIAQLQMSSEPSDQARGTLDRRAVDEIIVPLAYFIRERTEPEPREALASRAELFRKSVEQTRPLPFQHFPYLRSAIDSLKQGSFSHSGSGLTPSARKPSRNWVCCGSSSSS